MNSEIELYSSMLELLDKEIWLNMDKDVDYHVKASSAMFYTWEFLMRWIPKHADKFEPGDEGDICDYKAFIKRFCVFLEAVDMTDIEKVHGRYLTELVKIKIFWRDIEVDGKKVITQDGKLRASLSDGKIDIEYKDYIKDFWNNYVMRNGKKVIKKNEEVFWLLLACVFYFGGHDVLTRDLRGINKQKSIMVSSNKKDDEEDVNEPIKWCIGCYADICFLPDREGKERTEGLTSRFGRYEYMGGLFDFSQHFMYKKNYIEMCLAERLEAALRKRVGTCFAENWTTPMMYIESPWQCDVDDCGEEEEALKGIRYCIGKGYKKPQRGRRTRYMSEETPGTLEGIKEYFPHHQDLAKFLIEPTYIEEKGKSEDEILLSIYRNKKIYLYKRFICSFFVRLWPSKKTYESLVLTDLALGEVVNAVCIRANEERLERAEKAASRILGEIKEDDEEDYEEEGDEDENDGIQNPQKVESIMKRYIVSSIEMKSRPCSEKEEWYSEMEDDLRCDRDMAIGCLYDMFGLGDSATS